MSTKVKCRDMRHSDLPEILELEQRCFSMPWSRRAFEDDLKNKLSYFLVLEEEETVIGYAGMWVVINEAHITNVCVSPEHRRKGYAKRLMRELMRLALDKQCDIMTLEVRKSNQGAITLYEELGFETCGVRKEYYRDNKEDANIMWNLNISACLCY